MSVETNLLERLEELSWLEAPERLAVFSPADSPDVAQYLNDLAALERMPVPSPSMQRMAEGRLALLRAIQQPQRRLLAMPLVWAPRRLGQAIPATAMAAVLVASTLGGAAVAGVDVPGASVSEVLSALGLREAPDETPRAPIVLPAYSPTSSPSAPDNAGTSVPVPGVGDDGQSNAVEPPGQGGENPGQGGNPPGQSGENPGHGGTPPGQGGEDPGQGGNPPGQSGENPGQGGDNPGQGGDNPGQGGENPGQGNGNESTGPPEDPGQSGDNPGQGNGQGNKP